MCIANTLNIGRFQTMFRQFYDTKTNRLSIGYTYNIVATNERVSFEIRRGTQTVWYNNGMV